MRHDQFGFYFSVSGCIASALAVLSPLALTVAGFLYIAGNICWIKHAKKQGEAYLGRQHKIFIATSVLLMVSGAVGQWFPNLLK
jgi:hypothetical protein